MQPIFEMWQHFVAFFAVMVAFFTIICGIAFYYHNFVFIGTIQVYGEGYPSLLSPRRLRAKYTHCTNFVYAMGISPLQGAKVTVA